MKSIAIISFSLTGYTLGERVKRLLEERGIEVSLDVKSRYLSVSSQKSLREWTKEKFFSQDALVFIGACGIAVRAIAPFAAGKKTDPAVLVMDECGRFVISLLSGHLGGANELTAWLSEKTGAIPVITTATDLHGRFAVDIFAKERSCAILNMAAAKEVSAAVLAGEPVGFYSEFPIQGRLPEGLILCDSDGRPVNEKALEQVQNKEKLYEETLHGKEPDKELLQRKVSNEKDLYKKVQHREQLRVGVAVTIHTDVMPFSSTALVIPLCVTLGIGCKRGKDSSSIYTRVQETLSKAQIRPQALALAASIDLKADEAGLVEAVKRLGIPFQTFSGQALSEVPGIFTQSAFVSSVTGVDNVCERSAVLGSGHGTLIQKKTAANGVTVALAVRDWRVDFE